MCQFGESPAVCGRGGVEMDFLSASLSQAREAPSLVGYRELSINWSEIALIHDRG